MGKLDYDGLRQQIYDECPRCTKKVALLDQLFEKETMPSVKHRAKQVSQKDLTKAVETAVESFSDTFTKGDIEAKIRAKLPSVHKVRIWQTVNDLVKAKRITMVSEPSGQRSASFAKSSSLSGAPVTAHSSVNG